MQKNITKQILLVEDDESILEPLKYVLEKEGYVVRTATNGKDALEIMSSSTHNIDVILSDIRMPLVDGYSLVKELKEAGNSTPIILMTAFGTIQTAVDAMRNGVYDFLTKPIKINDLKATLAKALEFSQILLGDNEIQNKNPAVKKTSLISESDAMKKVFELVDRVARVDSTVLILGESGVGKEVVANEIHHRSARKTKNFIAINCAAIPGDLLESELFGHTKGSFTGATNHKKGLFEEAEGGTLFLDEIGDMTSALQAKLLRVLQEKKIRAVGSNNSKDLNVRIIAATHRNLRSAIINGTFREDLYYRLSVIPIIISPLRERKEDIRSLAIHFAKRASQKINEGYKTFSEEALIKLQSLPWQGNVRELENAVERCLVMCPRNVIQSQDLTVLDWDKDKEVIQPCLSLKDIEKDAVLYALKQTDGKKAEAAKLLGINRKTLHRKELEYKMNNHA
jgi:DNA-binding NtrC family response regulator